MRIILYSCLLLCLCFQPILGAQEDPRTNILFIMADDLGMECLGSYGGTSYPTPNLDALAASGLRFTQCYSTPKCTPTRVNLLTGRYGFRTGQAWGHLPEDEITFATVLQDAGYRTAVAGKWQMNLLKENPAYPKQKGFAYSSLWAWHEGPRYWNPMIWQDGSLLQEEIAEDYGPDVYKQYLMDFMHNAKGTPFLAYYPMCLPHFPKTGGKYIEPKGPNGRYQNYKEMMAHIDRIVGELVTFLEEEGLRENTLIMFTGDNGTPQQVTSQFKGAALQGGKSLHTNTGTHVPLIASWPGTIAPNSTTNHLVDFSDFFPTFCAMANAPMPTDRPMDGQSLLPLLKGETYTPRPWIYTEYEGLGWIRNHDWKLYTDGRFYNMSNDPDEKRTLSTDTLEGTPLEEHTTLKQALMVLRVD